MNNLIVLAGPRCVGKSKIINDLKTNKITGFFSQLKLNKHSFAFSNMNSIDINKVRPEENLLIHYDFFRPFMRKYKDYYDDSIFNLTSHYKNVFYITLASPINELSQRLKSRVHLLNTNNKFESDKLKVKLEKLSMLEEIYTSEDKLLSHYIQWLDFCFNIDTNKNYLLFNSITGYKLDFYNSKQNLLKILSNYL